MPFQTWLLTSTAVLEAVTGLALLSMPLIPLELLLGVKQAAPETIVITRLAGAALLAIGVICFLTRTKQHGSESPGVLVGILIYNITAVILLSYAGIGLNLTGILLWPAVVLHTLLTLWCVACLRPSKAKIQEKSADKLNW